ncbi:MAG: hypothetical protein ACRELV_17290 [Longimicrobiales bacterium]
MVYIGSSVCASSNQPHLPQSIETIKIRLARLARERGMSFKAVGIALDWAPAPGIEHLAKFGLFDEVSAGYNWGNTLALRYLWSEAPARASTPQVVVYQRELIAPTDSGDVLHYAELERRRLVAKIGSGDIIEWAASGVQLPKEEGDTHFTQEALQ